MPILTFTSGWPPYNAGEVAGFTDEEAEALAAANAPVAPYVNDNIPAAEQAPEDATPAEPVPALPSPAPGRTARRAADSQKEPVE